MNDTDRFDIVRSSPLGSDLDDDACKRLAEIIGLRSLEDNEVLIAEGHCDHTLYGVVSGTLAVTRDVSGGEWVSLQLLRTGDLAGAMGFVDGKPHSATLRSVGTSQVFSLEREAFEGMIESEPATVYQVMRAIIRSVHDILMRMNVSFVELTNYVTKQHGRY